MSLSRSPHFSSIVPDVPSSAHYRIISKISHHYPGSYIGFFLFPVPLPFFFLGGQSMFCRPPLLTFVQHFMVRTFYISTMCCSECCTSAAPAHCPGAFSNIHFHGDSLCDGAVWSPERTLCTTALQAQRHLVIDIQSRILLLLSL